MQETTSELRLALCAAITRQVSDHGDAERKQWLMDELERRSYETMTDDALVEMAYQAGVPEATVVNLVQTKSAQRVAVQARYLCIECRDSGHVLTSTDPNRYGRCPGCNPDPDPDPEYHPERN